jgi:cupin superfamily acireductone dioxygenase involved in methionine salvage
MDSPGLPFFGNADTDNFGRGWVVGHFVDDGNDLRATEDVEIKWSTHPAGDKRAAWTTGEHRTTISLLVSGRFTIHLSTGVFTLEKPGDYLVWGPGIRHWWEAVQDSVMVTVRWPSR